METQTSSVDSRSGPWAWHLALITFAALGILFLADWIFSIRLQSPLAVRRFFFNPFADLGALLSPIIVGIAYRRVRPFISPPARQVYVLLLGCCVLYVALLFAGAFAFALTD